MATLSVIIPLVAATVASGATAALYHHRFRFYRRLYRSMQRREAEHLETIYRLRKQLHECRYPSQY